MKSCLLDDFYKNQRILINEKSANAINKYDALGKHLRTNYDGFDALFGTRENQNLINNIRVSFFRKTLSLKKSKTICNF